ncbi:benzoyl-CoA-dihydrodiol lyase [mine drainage metagenome]|uniref:Benzoyl-CoA-dihydrodiol lyase n=1 Tax=mine drainage metagenome TaxID=410659 RepID=A0A1J5SF79_9ZZZZ
MNPNLVTYDTDPSRYAHWKIVFKGNVATLILDIQEDRGIRPGYKLKLNSYDLGVDIELHDALQRIRFEHPEVKTVVLTSGKPRMFCSGANIYMLGLSSHAWKVNFCKFTNETRNGIEESSRSSGLKFLAAVNGACAGGGYEVALACDEIVMVDDRSTAVSLPEVPLLGVLPGTGGLTRLVDKRRVRRDLADVFSTTSEGVRAERARQWKLIDDHAKPQQFDQMVESHAQQLASLSDRPGGAGVALTPLARRIDEQGYHYETVDVAIDRARRIASFTLTGPQGSEAQSVEAIRQAGAQWWPLKFARELDDAILMLRTNDLEVGTWVFRSQGDVAAMLAMDAVLADHANDWLVRETVNFLRRVLRRIDVSSRSIFALIEPGSCFAGTLLEVALAADRSFMLDSNDDDAPRLALSAMNFGPFTMNNDLTRLATRFAGDEEPVAAARAAVGRPLSAAAAAELGLVTFTPDALDWNDEIRIALEERTSLSPDALTGMEANLRFSGRETMDTRIFGRLTAWQNWIFQRPNAVGEKGALKVYGSGNKSQFNWERV